MQKKEMEKVLFYSSFGILDKGISTRFRTIIVSYRDDPHWYYYDYLHWRFLSVIPFAHLIIADEMLEFD